jgi:hypothetical protein
LVPCHLAAGFGYQDAPAVMGGVAAEAPFDLRIDLDGLR